MSKLVKTIGFVIAIATVGTIAGCDLYFNDKGGSSPSASSGGSGGSAASGSGFECSMNTDCAAGCYCANGTCTEGGFCQTNSDCGPGYQCDTNRSSCEPITCTCTSDADAISKGFGWCDETTGTCETGTDPAGDCNDAVTCTTAPPACPEGNVALVLNGCYTGACRAITACESAPACSHLQHEDDCLSPGTCDASYTGIDCHKPDGSACHDGDTNCTCTSFEFNSCSAKTP
jgi:hypothetical protein